MPNSLSVKRGPNALASSAFSITAIGDGLPCGLQLKSDGTIRGRPGVSGVFSVGVVISAIDDNALTSLQLNGGAGNQTITITISDCDDTATCGTGRCVDLVPFDSEYQCERKNGVKFEVAWPNFTFPRMTLQQQIPPDVPRLARAQGVSDGAALLYSATNLPCGISLDPATGALTGRPGQSGVFTGVEIIARTPEDGGLSTLVNNATFALKVEDCEDSVSCGSGVCVDTTPYDGQFNCSCPPSRSGQFCEARSFDVSWSMPRQYARNTVLAATVGVPFSSPVPAGVLSTLPVKGYFLRQDLPCGLYINASTGQIQGTSSSPRANSALSILAESESGQVTTVNKAAFTFSVKDCDDAATCNGGKCIDSTRYDGQYLCDCTDTGKTGPRCSQERLADFTVSWPGFPAALLPRAVLGHRYTLAAPAQIKVQGGGDTITYSASGLPCGMAIDAETGALSGAPGESGNYTTLAVFAQSEGRSAKVDGVDRVLQVVDCDDQISCNGGLCVDDVPWDGDFSCDCNGTGVGEYCAAAVVAASAGSNTSSYVAAGIGGVLFVALVVLAVQRYRVVKKRNQPLSFDDALDKIKRQGLLLSGPADGRSSRPREIPRRCVTVLEVIGEGAFGEVRSLAPSRPAAAVLLPPGLPGTLLGFGCG